MFITVGVTALFWIPVLCFIVGLALCVRTYLKQVKFQSLNRYIGTALVTGSLVVPLMYGFDMDYTYKYRVTGEVSSVTNYGDSSVVRITEAPRFSEFRVDGDTQVSNGQTIDMLCTLTKSDPPVREEYFCTLP